MIIWRLNKGADRRLRAHHPWVFSNELSASPKGVEPGSAVEIQDARGQFLARGYGNPRSLIAFRALSFDAAQGDPCAEAFLVQRLLAAYRLRQTQGLRHSFRLCFAEADFLPGLIIDRYRGADSRGAWQVFSMQQSTAGMDRLIPDPCALLRAMVEALAQEQAEDHRIPWARTGIVLRNDLAIRQLEGLESMPARVLRQIEGLDYRRLPIQISAGGEQPLSLICDLIAGQKTGFFLDQAHNIALLRQLVLARQWPAGAEVRILDLCCYVGQWSAQIAAALQALGCRPKVTLVDASAQALALAQENVRPYLSMGDSLSNADSLEVLQADVLQGLGPLPSAQFDVVIADPPAFIKARKDIPAGRHAYLKLNSQAFRLVKPGGWVVSCSCSGLLNEEDFRETLAKAALRHHPGSRVVLRGGHGPDHPTLLQFSEGNYLKMLVCLAAI